MRTISDYIPTKQAGLPKPREMEDEGEASTSSDLTGFRRELFDQMMRDQELLIEAFSELAVACRTDTDRNIQEWQQDSSLTKLLSFVVKLPLETATEPFKVTGNVPKSLDANAANAFEALVLLYSARALFFAERRGFHGLLSAVDSRVEKYRPYLCVEEAWVVSGFRTLFSLLTDPPVVSSIYRYASSAWQACSVEDRALMCLGATRDLLRAWGKSGESRA
jgi:hypothetical protein